LHIHSVAVVAQPIAASAGTAFVLRNLAAVRTCTVIVMHAIERWLSSLIDGVEHWCRGHSPPPFIPSVGGSLVTREPLEASITRARRRSSVSSTSGLRGVLGNRPSAAVGQRFQTPLAADSAAFAAHLGHDL
jgi:hypothetical protein